MNTKIFKSHLDTFDKMQDFSYKMRGVIHIINIQYLEKTNSYVVFYYELETNNNA